MCLKVQNLNKCFSILLREIAEFVQCSQATIRRELGDLVEKYFVGELRKKPLVFSLSDEGKDLLGLD